MGSTSTEWTYQQTLATLEGIGTVVQETRLARGRRVKTTPMGGQPWAE